MGESVGLQSEAVYRGAGHPSLLPRLFQQVRVFAQKRDASGVAIPLYDRLQKTRLRHLMFHIKSAAQRGVQR